MKNFSRTLIGKTLLFILCMVMMTLSLASLLVAMFMLSEDFYTNTEEDLFELYSSSIVRSSMEEALSHYDGEIEEYERGGSAFKTIVVEGEKNIIYQIVDGDRVLIKTDNSGGVSAWSYEFPILKEGNRLTYPIYSLRPNSDSEVTGLKIRASLLDEYVAGDRIALLHGYLGFFYSLRHAIYALLLVFGTIAVFSYVFLLNASARRKNSEELHPGIFNKVPFDLLILLVLLFFIMGFGSMGTLIHLSGALALFYVLILGLMMLASFIGLSMSVAARVKQGTMKKNNLIYKIYLLIRSVLLRLYTEFRSMLEGVPLMPKLIAALLIFFFLEYVILHYNYHATGSLRGTYIFWFFKNLIILFLASFLAYSMALLSQGAARLAKGELSYKIDDSKLYLGFCQHARDLNSIAKGMERAVEERLKSERMKTELITNVSHDIKTPLTSLINYSGLVAGAAAEIEPDIDTIREYSSVLMRQSDKLKKLIEDLVEASKASTGNLELSLEATDAALYLSQISGEYEDRLKEAGLHLVMNTSIEENEAFIMADSRRMWRIFENIMNNICKYSLSGTRVFLGLALVGDRVEFSFKNTSREVLNIDPSELFERFTRGDRSRTTEGNGLGLSIAKSLAELQGGSMDIVIDGDLFKVILGFPRS